MLNLLFLEKIFEQEEESPNNLGIQALIEDFQLEEDLRLGAMLTLRTIKLPDGSNNVTNAKFNVNANLRDEVESNNANVIRQLSMTFHVNCNNEGYMVKNYPIGIGNSQSHKS